VGKRSRVIDPICRVMIKNDDGVATFAVYGPNRRLVWWSVHAPTPTVVRLWPRVVRYLRDVLDELTDPSNRSLVWQLPRSSSHPEYLTIRMPAGDPWLYIFATSPNAVQLTPARIAFLREALADLPTMSPTHVDTRRRSGVAAVRAAGA
jgi:hypothetical protein